VNLRPCLDRLVTKIEDLLRTGASDPDSAAWDELYQEVCHQGHCYPDGFFLLPHLADIAAALAPADRDNALIFAGQIAVDLDETSRVQFDEALVTLRRLADDAWLSAPVGRQLLTSADDERRTQRTGHPDIRVSARRRPARVAQSVTALAAPRAIGSPKEGDRRADGIAVGRGSPGGGAGTADRCEGYGGSTAT
jgi:hypothetical protein